MANWSSPITTGNDTTARLQPRENEEQELSHIKKREACEQQLARDGAHRSSVSYQRQLKRHTFTNAVFGLPDTKVRSKAHAWHHAELNSTHGMQQNLAAENCSATETSTWNARERSSTTSTLSQSAADVDDADKTIRNATFPGVMLTDLSVCFYSYV